MRAPTSSSKGESLTVAGLFAGIGGIELGLHRAGHRTELLCEIDPGAARVLRRGFPEIPVANDVSAIRRIGDWPSVDVIAAGFPCQDLSQAGRTAGIAGEQSGLVGHVFRLLDLARTSRRNAWQPKWLLFENVSFMLQLEGGRAMRHLVDELEARGFSWAYRVVDTNAFGLPQRRQRVLLLASQSADPRGVLFADESSPVRREFARDLWCGFYWTEGTRGLGWAVDAIPTLKGGSTIGIPSPPAIWVPESGMVGTPSLRDAERLQGFPPDWTAPAAEGDGEVRVGKSPRRLTNHRWKLVGNAVSVPVAEWLGKRLSTPGPFDPSASVPLKAGVAWPRAAWGCDGQVYTISASLWPVRLDTPHLSEFLSDDLTPLSERATAGFYSRITAKACGLRFESGFKDAIAGHLARVRRARAAVA